MIIASLAGGTATIPTPPSLHAPDGFLSFPVAAVMWVLTLVMLAIAIQRTN